MINSLSHDPLAQRVDQQLARPGISVLLIATSATWNHDEASTKVADLTSNLSSLHTSPAILIAVGGSSYLGTIAFIWNDPSARTALIKFFSQKKRTLDGDSIRCLRKVADGIIREASNKRLLLIQVVSANDGHVYPVDVGHFLSQLDPRCREKYLFALLESGETLKVSRSGRGKGFSPILSGATTDDEFHRILGLDNQIGPNGSYDLFWIIGKCGRSTCASDRTGHEALDSSLQTVLIHSVSELSDAITDLNVH